MGERASTLALPKRITPCGVTDDSESNCESTQTIHALEVQIVYLDQNAASLLAKPDSEPIWKEIREALAEGFGDRKLICPLPFEGVIESAPCSSELRKLIQGLFWQLSEGIAFEEFTQMSNELTLALIRPIPNWSPWIIWKPGWAEMVDVAQKVASDWKAEKERMTARMNGFVRSSNLEAMSERELFHTVAKQRSIRIYNDLDCLLAGQVNGSLMLPWLIEFLISENISPAEIEALKRAIQYHGWEKIPIHVFDILLGARWEYDSIRGGTAAYEPNDEIDRKRAAIALNHADLFITEGGIADLCRRAKVNDYCPTLVVSVRDPQRVLDAVRSINTG